MNLKRYFILSIFTAIGFFSFSQIENKGIPYIKNYDRTDYDGNNQTFSIVQDNRGIMYFANQIYLLEYDGKTWRKIFIPGDPNIYSLTKDQNGKIYVGASVGELGYLKIGQAGNMKYQTLTDKIPEKKRQFTIVRKVLITKNNHALFVTPQTLYIYENDTIKTIDISKPENNFSGAFKVKDKIFVHEKGKGILEFKDDKLELVKGTESYYAKKQPFGIFPAKENDLYITSWQDSVKLFSHGNIKSVNKNPLLYNLIYPSIYNDKYYLGGLYGKGMVITDNKLNIIKHISKDNGLQNNTVWCVYTDRDKNIWIGTNDGISIIYANLPYTVFSAYSNISEAVTASFLYKNNLYIGTSAGLLFRNFDFHNNPESEKFEFIKNKTGHTQIWKIDTVNNSLLFAGQSGLFEIKDSVAYLIGPSNSIKSFIQLKNRPEKILAIGGHGLSLFTFSGGKWKFNHIIKNYKGNYRHLEEDNNGTFWISDRSRGIFRIKLNEKLDSVIENINFTEKDGLPDIYGNYVFKINNKIIFTTKKGIYKFDEKTQKFIKDDELNALFDNKEIYITNLYQAKNGNIWFKEAIDNPKTKKQTWELGLIKFKNGTYKKMVKTPFYKVKNNIFSINQISDNELVVGTESGFVLYNLDVNKKFEEPFPTLIRKIEFIKNDSLLFGGAFQNDSGLMLLQQTPENIPKIPFEFNDLRFYFSSVFFEEPEKTQYKFILKGNDTEWSDWKYKTDKEYSNLDPGTYTFIVKARNLYNVESKTAEYTFEILPPWYRTFGAYIGYFILFILFIYGIIQLSVYRLKKQKENLKRIVEERTKEIQLQKEEIEAKNEILSEQNKEISEKNASITASINYAKRIQEAMLPLKEKISHGLPENFILFKPRDIVSGDFYWYSEKNGKIIYTAVDCTGHGVPGALMSMIGSEILTTIVNSNGITKADKILSEMNNYVVKALKQETESLSQDGMDMALCVIDKENKTVEFAGAKNPLVYITNGELKQIKASRYGIGGYQEEEKTYNSELIQYESPAWFYMFSDGFQDQFGGPKNRKFMIKRLKQLLFDIHYKPMEEQKEILDKVIEEWMKNTAQTDDIILIGFKL